MTYVFDIFDKNYNGYLDYEELRELMIWERGSITEDNLKRQMRYLDAD